MTSAPNRRHLRRIAAQARLGSNAPGWSWRLVGAAGGAFSLLMAFAIAPPAASNTGGQDERYVSRNPQTLSVSERSLSTTDGGLIRDGYSTSAAQGHSSATGATNYDWAAQVMLAGGWPTSDSNITVMVRWMRQENGANNWWNRNNPMNNGYGSGGGGGTGSYANLGLAAQKAAENLQRNPSFSAIVQGFASSAPTGSIEQAIWASPWASGHYGNGSRWHTSPVDMVNAPADAWVS